MGRGFLCGSELAAVDGDVGRGVDADTDAAVADVDDGDRDGFTDLDSFVRLPG
jgi:hypothetical protein